MINICFCSLIPKYKRHPSYLKLLKDVSIIFVRVLNLIMAHLTETQRIDILIMIGCSNKTRTQKEVCEIFGQSS